jgi:hypothetical protein
MGRLSKEKAIMSAYHKIENVRFRRESRFLTIDEIEKEFNIKALSSVLANASETERLNYEISPAGYGIHWTLLDEGLSIDGLLGVSHKPEFVRKSA